MGRELRVRTSGGLVRGRWDGSVAVFRGIPYAQPPTGPRRFAAPVPAAPWEGVRAAAEFGPLVPQPGVPDGADEWLTLNVWSPDPGATGLPVLVWICGGGYVWCRPDNPHHDGATLAAAGAVVVSMSYRVGMEGFARIAGAPDNRGILDQAAALAWVQENAAAFGGDPGNVTVFGQSAGAGCIAALLTMPGAAGLFRRAILQSVPATFLAADLAQDMATAIAAEAAAAATAGELTPIPPRDLVRAADAVTRRMPSLTGRWGPMASTPTAFSPVVGGAALPRAPWAALADGAARDVEVIVGHTRDEHRLYALGRDVTPAQADAALELLAPGGPPAYRAAYPDATPAALWELVNADWLMRMPSLHLAEAHVAGGGQAWIYELTWGFGPNGASHSLDVLLVLGTLDPAGEQARAVGDRMRADWIAFATAGDPGWPAYDRATRPTRVYGAEPATMPYPEEPSRRIWRHHRFGALGLPGIAV